MSDNKCTIEIRATDDSPYDLLCTALGFESRATAVSQRLSRRSERCIAFGFDHNCVLAYKTNESWFIEQRFLVKGGLSADDFLNAFDDEILKLESDNAAPTSSGISIAIDCSCFDRARLAVIVDRLRRSSRRLTVDFYYCIGAFIPPSENAPRNEVAGPVHHRYAGRFYDPSRPIALVSGLGYEVGKVVGAVEYIQASRVVAFLPKSPVQEYEREVVMANNLLLQELPESDILHYDVDDPMRTIATLDSVVRGLLRTNNVVMLPGGPKIFALSCLLVHSLHNECSIWRVSTGASIEPRDVKPSGHIVSTRAIFIPAPA